MQCCAFVGFNLFLVLILFTLFSVAFVYGLLQMVGNSRDGEENLVDVLPGIFCKLQSAPSNFFHLWEFRMFLMEGHISITAKEILPNDCIMFLVMDSSK